MCAHETNRFPPLDPGAKPFAEVGGRSHAGELFGLDQQAFGDA